MAGGGLARDAIGTMTTLGVVDETDDLIALTRTLQERMSAMEDRHQDELAELRAVLGYTFLDRLRWFIGLRGYGRMRPCQPNQKVSNA